MPYPLGAWGFGPGVASLLTVPFVPLHRPHSASFPRLAGASVDGAALIDEFRAAADSLSLSLIQDPTALTEEDASVVGLNGGRGQGDMGAADFLGRTHVVPVFVLSLKAVPPGLAMTDGGFVAASDNLVIVLQVRGPMPCPR